MSDVRDLIIGAALWFGGNLLVLIVGGAAFAIILGPGLYLAERGIGLGGVQLGAFAGFALGRAYPLIAERFKLFQGIRLVVTLLVGGVLWQIAHQHHAPQIGGAGGLVIGYITGATFSKHRSD